MIAQPNKPLKSVDIMLMPNGKVKFEGDNEEAVGYVELIRKKMDKPVQEGKKMLSFNFVFFSGKPETLIKEPICRPKFLLLDENFKYEPTVFPTGMSALIGSFGAVSKATWASSPNDSVKIVARKFGSGQLGNSRYVKNFFEFFALFLI